jgi:hypothetical protein
MPQAGFEPAIPATKRPQTYALDRTATGIGDSLTSISSFNKSTIIVNIKIFVSNSNSVVGNQYHTSYYVYWYVRWCFSLGYELFSSSPGREL